MTRDISQRRGNELLDDLIALVKQHGDAVDDVEEYHRVLAEIRRRMLEPL